ncbi:MAG: polysaccharide biosynthesis C-terminal domain-containing protein [Clostridia bacterium]|nr:polysaccharide biosynthesis C-terminal domain-containing protein [Clostridia bacterium]
MNKYKKLLTNTAILAFGMFGSKLLVLLLTPLYTACLSRAEYSVADLLAQASNLLIPIVAVGLYMGVFRFASDAWEDRKTVFSTASILLFFSVGVFLALSPLLTMIDQFEGYGWLIIPYVAAAILHYLLSYYIRAEGRTVMFAVQGILNTLLTVSLNILFLVGFRWTVLGFVLSVIVSDFVISVGIFFAARIYRVFSFRSFSKKTAFALLRYSLWLIPGTVFWWITEVSDRFVVTYYMGHEVNGLYSIAYKIPTLITLVSVVFSEAWQYSAFTEDKDSPEYRKFYETVYSNFAAVMFIAASGLIWLCRWLASWMFAQEYYDAWHYIPFLLASTLFLALVTFLGSVYLVQKKTLFSMLTAVAGATLNIVLNFLLIPRWGPMGAAVATLSCYVLVFVIRVIDARRYVRFSVQPVRTVVNTAVLGGQTAILLLEISGWFWWEALCVAVMIAINLRPMLRAFKSAISSIRNRKKGGESEKQTENADIKECGCQEQDLEPQK